MITTMDVQVSAATLDDAAAVATLADEFAQSYPFDRTAFDRSYPALLAHPDARLLVATGPHVLGYVLGFSQPTLHANGPRALVEEIVVHGPHRQHGIGRALMTGFEQWAVDRDCAYVALATRRAAPFYLALGYQESAVYLRKTLLHSGQS